MLWQREKKNGRTLSRLLLRSCRRLLARLQVLICDDMLTAIACSMITIGISLLLIGISLLHISAKGITFAPDE